MYKVYNDDNDSDFLATRGQDVEHALRLAAEAVSRLEDPAARQAGDRLTEALRLITDILYDLSEPYHSSTRVTTQHVCNRNGTIWLS